MSPSGNIPAWLQRSNGERIPLEGNASIGRSASNQVVIPDEKVSRRHAMVHLRENGEFWLVDAGSSNGTYLNGRRVIQPMRLADGDEVTVGGFAMVFKQPATPADTHSGCTQTLAEHTLLDIRSASLWLLLADIESSTQLQQRLTMEEASQITGRWLTSCKEAVDAGHGTITKYLGDGFMACWRDTPEAVPCLVKSLEELRNLQERAPLRFRVVLHFGLVAVGGVPSLGEESHSGKEVTFAFRMEKLAAKLGEPRLMSAAAQARLADAGRALSRKDLGPHALAGFDGEFRFFSF